MNLYPQRTGQHESRHVSGNVGVWNVENGKEINQYIIVLLKQKVFYFMLMILKFEELIMN